MMHRTMGLKRFQLILTVGVLQTNWRCGVFVGYVDIPRYKTTPFSFHYASFPNGPGSPHYRSFTITLRHTALDRTPLDEWSAWRGYLYMTTHNAQKRQDIHASGGIRTRNPRKWSAAEPCLRRRGHWDRLKLPMPTRKYTFIQHCGFRFHWHAHLCMLCYCVHTFQHWN